MVITEVEDICLVPVLLVNHSFHLSSDKAVVEAKASVKKVFAVFRPPTS
jgi:hypothetical protein